MLHFLMLDFLHVSLFLQMFIALSLQISVHLKLYYFIYPTLLLLTFLSPQPHPETQVN